MSKHSQFEVKVLRTLEEVEQLRSIWPAMQWSPDPESDIDFVCFIIRIRPEIIRPHVLVVFEEGKPIALVAGRLEHSQFAIKFGYKVLWRTKIQRIAIFYGGFMGKTDATIGEVVVRSLLRSLHEEKADLLVWAGVQRGSVLQTLLSRTPNLLCRDWLARFLGHWTMKMPVSLDELLKQRLNKKQRYNAKRAMQMIEKDFPGEVRYASYATLAGVDELFQNAVKIAKMTYQWGLGVGFQGNQENKDRLTLEAQQGWFRGWVLFVKNDPVAFWIATVYKGKVYMDYTGYDPRFRNYEVGTALFLRMIGELCKDNVKQLDFGPGAAFYKEQFGDASFEEATFCTFSATLRGMVFGGLNFVTQGPLELGRALLKRFGLEQKLKKIWRRFKTPAVERKESFHAHTPVAPAKSET